MKLKDVMSSPVETVSPDSTIEEIALRMKSVGAGVLPVCDGEKIRGIVTDRDLVLRGIAEGKDPKATKASEVMTEGVCYSFEDEDIQQASRNMREHGVRRLVVLDRAKRLVGMVSLGDLTRKGDDIPAAARVIQRDAGASAHN